MNSKRAVGALAIAALAWAVDPGEIKVTSRPYFPRPKTTIRIDTKLVEVGVVVRDGRGHPIGGLGRDDFEISDNGKKRTITAFSVEEYKRAAEAGRGAAAANATAPPAENAAPKRPRFVALMFDDMALNADEYMRSKAAALRFVKEGFGPNVRAGVFTTSQVGNLPFTDDAAKVEDAIAHIRFQQRQPVGGMCPQLTPYDAYSIVNNVDQETLEVKVSEYMACSPQPSSGGGRSKRGGGSSGLNPTAVREVQAMANAIWEQVRMNSLNTLGSVRDLVDYMTKFDGDRVILMASPGFLTGTLEQDEDDLIVRALHAGVVINSIDAKGLFTTPNIEMTMGANVRSVIHQQNLGTRPLQAASDVLGTLAESTGGLFFHNNNDLTMGFRELGMVPEVSYLLAFAPDAPDGKFHKLKVKANAKGAAEVQARPGYMSVAPDASEQHEDRPIDRAAMAADTVSDAPVTFWAQSAQSASGAPALKVLIHIDLAKLKFHEGFGLRTQKLAFIAALFDNTGKYVTGQEGEMQFALSDATYKQYAPEGLNASLTLEAAPGEYRLRGVVQESLDGKLAAGTQPVTVK